MANQIAVWVCDLCGLRYNSKKEAEACEKHHQAEKTNAPLYIDISSSDSQLSITIDQTYHPEIAGQLYVLFSTKLDLKPFEGLPNTMKMRYEIQATIERHIQEWRRSGEYGVWPDIVINVLR